MINKLPDFTPVIKDLNKSKATVTISMDKRSVSSILERQTEYKALPEKLRGGIENVADYVRSDMISRTFRREGPGWKPLAKRTQRERIAGGYGAQHPILQRKRDLYKELTDKNHPNHVEIIKVGKNARIEIGGSSSKFIENQLGRTEQRLPARPMIPGTGNIPVLESDRRQMLRILEKSYQQYINKPT